MEFTPIVAKELKTMDPRLYREAKMGLGAIQPIVC
jgi:acyl CoA:acetate/3-ketoacid CoA transferase